LLKLSVIFAECTETLCGIWGKLPLIAEACNFGFYTLLLFYRTTSCESSFSTL